MGFTVRALVCLGVGAMSLAHADPPAPSPAAATATAAAAAETPAVPQGASPPAAATSPPATQGTNPGPAAATPAKPTGDAIERQLLSQGYKPEMRNGQKLYCRREQVLGSRLAEAKHCGTIEQLKVSVQESRDAVEKIQRNQKNPQGG